MDNSVYFFRDSIIKSEKYLNLLGLWPHVKTQWHTLFYIVLFCGYALILLIKNLLQPEEESIENAVTLANGNIAIACYLIPMVLKKNKFRKLFEFLKADQKVFISLKHKEVLEAGVKEYQLITNVFFYILFPSVLMKFIHPPIVYVYIELFNPDKIFHLPPPMGLPAFLFGEIPTYIVESLLRMIMITSIIAICILFIFSSLHVITYCNILSMEMENFNENSHAVINKLIKTHQELLEHAKLINEMFSLFFFSDCVLSYVNISILLFSLVVSNASITNYLLEVPMMTVGMCQLFFLLYFGDRLIDAVGLRQYFNDILFIN